MLISVSKSDPSALTTESVIIRTAPNKLINTSADQGMVILMSVAFGFRSTGYGRLPNV